MEMSIQEISTKENLMELVRTNGKMEAIMKDNLQMERDKEKVFGNRITVINLKANI